MARILAISSQVVYGPVGNTAATPPLFAAGHEVMQIPTILLSHHPGHGKPAGEATSPELFENLLAGAARIGAFNHCDALMTGYFANARQIEIVSRYWPQINAKIILVDPVMGDHGALYVAESTAIAIRDLLLPHATITTPNAFELSWLTGQPANDTVAARKAASQLGPPEVLVTSVSEVDKLATLLVTGQDAQIHVTPLRPNVPHGTGDFLAGCYLAARLAHDPAAAFHSAMRKLETAIASSSGGVLDVT